MRTGPACMVWDLGLLPDSAVAVYFEDTSTRSARDSVTERLPLNGPLRGLRGKRQSFMSTFRRSSELAHASIRLGGFELHVQWSDKQGKFAPVATQ